MDFEIKDFDKEIGKIIIIKDGIEIECKILFTFNSENTMKNYIVFTDNLISTSGRNNIYVKSYNPFSPKLKFEDITDEKELEMINEILYEIDGTIE